MGFTEELRRSFEEQKRIKKEEEVRRTTRAAQEEEERSEREKQLRERLAIEAKQRHDQAIVFHQRSGIGKSVEELGLLLGEICREKNRKEHPYDEPYIIVFEDYISGGEKMSILRQLELAGSNEANPDHRILSYLADKDSVVDFVFWERQSRYFSDYRARGGQIRTCREYSEKNLIVETCPDGTTRFHGGWGGSSTIPFVRWANNLNLLDLKLKNAFEHPLNHTYRTNIEYGSDWNTRKPGEHGWMGAGTG